LWVLIFGTLSKGLNFYCGDGFHIFVLTVGIVNSRGENSLLCCRKKGSRFWGSPGKGLARGLRFLGFNRFWKKGRFGPLGLANFYIFWGKRGISRRLSRGGILSPQENGALTKGGC